MRPQKGCRYGTCPTCARRRRLWRDRIPGDAYRWTCSQGHTWVVLMSMLERINNVTLDILAPRIAELFLADSPLMGYLKRR